MRTRRAQAARVRSRRRRTDDLDPGARPEILHDGQIIALVVADTFEAAREAAHKVRRRLSERDSHRPSFDIPRRQRRGCRQASQARGSAGRRRRQRLRRRAGQDRCQLRDADAASQSDRAVHHHLRLAGRQADDLRAEPVRVRPEERRGASSLASIRTTCTSSARYVGGAFGSKAQ